MNYRILGALRVVRDGRDLDLGGPRQQLVLAVLLLHAGETVSTVHLVDAVWGTDPPSSARKTAQAYVSRLRRELDDGVIETTPAGYRLRAIRDDIDAGQFARLVGEARGHLPDDPVMAAPLLDAALALWRGAAWGALAERDVLAPDATRLTELRRGALEDRLEIDLALGRDAAAISELEGFVAAHPLRERARGLLMLGLYRNGQPAKALGLYDETRRTMAEELGVEPSPQLQHLHVRMLRQDPDLLVRVDARVARPVPTADVHNPYKGLRSFGVDDAGDFFGRRDVVDDLVARLEDEPFLALVGPSGSGKSSVVRAGVLPAVQHGATVGGGRALVATMVPGTHPFEELEAALSTLTTRGASPVGDDFRGDDLDVLRAGLRLCPGEDDRLLLVIDQFEELFLHVADPATARRFARNLAEAAEDPHGRVTTLVTLRADFADRPLAHARLGAWVDRGLVTLLPLSPAAIEEACVAPATALGVPVEPELAAELVAEVTTNPGALPQFQYALTQLFDERGSGGLTLAGHRRLGGVAGVLGRRAEEEFQALDEASQSLARALFLRLVTPGEATDDTRRRTRREELEGLADDEDAVGAILARFGTARLLTFDREAASGVATVEIAHEAMLGAWPRLQEWVDESREDLRHHRRIARGAAEWEEAGRHPDFLLSGTRLDQYDDRDHSTPLGTTVGEDRFLTASRAHRDEVARAEEQRREHELALEHRSVRRLRMLVGVMALALLLGTGLTASSVARGRALQQASDEAVVAAWHARARELAATAVANRDRDPDLAVNLVQHSVQILAETGETIPVDVVAALHWALQAAGATYPVRDAPVAVLPSPEGPRGVFDVAPRVLVEMAASSVGRTLRPEECELHLGNPTCPPLKEAVLAAAVFAPLPSVPDEGRPLAGTTVRVLSIDGDASQVATGLASALEDMGVRVEFDYERTFWADVLAGGEVEAGVDLGTVAQPSTAVRLGDDDVLQDLGGWYDMSEVRADLTPFAVSLGSSDGGGTAPSNDGRVWGLPYQVSNKSLIWYPVPEFADAGYEVPQSWTELEALVSQLQDDGRTPWCHGEANPSGTGTGWPGTDWIEEILLQTAGQDTYDAWVAGDLAFTDPAVRDAFERFDELVLGPGRVWSGRHAASELLFSEASPHLLGTPDCWLLHQASYAFGDEEDRRQVAAFPVPPLGNEAGHRVLVGGGYMVAMADRPEVRRALEYITGAGWAEAYATAGQWTFSLHRDVDTSLYPDDARLVAEALRGAVARGGDVRFDGSDLMPVEVNGAFWEGMEMFVRDGPDNLDQVLADIEAARPAS